MPNNIRIRPTPSSVQTAKPCSKAYLTSRDKLAGTRIIPLVIKKDKLEAASHICDDGPILDIKPFMVRKAAIITTGNEVYHGRIQDAFTT